MMPGGRDSAWRAGRERGRGRDLSHFLPSLSVTIKSLGEDKQTAVGRALTKLVPVSQQRELHCGISPIYAPRGTWRPESPWIP